MLKTTTPVDRPTSINSSIDCSPSDVPSSQVKVGNAPHLRTNSFISAILGKDPSPAGRIRHPLLHCLCPDQVGHATSLWQVFEILWRHSQFVTPESAQGRFLGEILEPPCGHKQDTGGVRWHFLSESKARHRPRNQAKGARKVYAIDHGPVPLLRSPSHPVEKRLSLRGNLGRRKPGSHVVTDSRLSGRIDDAVRKLGTNTRDSIPTHAFRSSKRLAAQNSSKPSRTSKSTMPPISKPCLLASKGKTTG